MCEYSKFEDELFLCKTISLIWLFMLPCNRSIDLIPEEGSGSVEIVPGGRDIQVNESNVFDYVRKYAEYRMIKTQEKALDVSSKALQHK